MMVSVPQNSMFVLLLDIKTSCIVNICHKVSQTVGINLCCSVCVPSVTFISFKMASMEDQPGYRLTVVTVSCYSDRSPASINISFLIPDLILIEINI